MFALLPTALLALSAPPPAGECVERALAAMGTTLVVEVEAPDRALALRASEAAVRAVEAVEARLSTWSDASELAALNRAPVGEPHALGPALAEDLALARRWWEETGGAFDPGVGALVDAWGLRSGGRRPSDDELAAARAASGLRHLELDGRTARRGHPDLRLEEGGFGKGIGLDAGLRAARDAGATAGRLDLGGQVLAFGAPVRLGVAHPLRRGESLLELVLEGGSVATSGNGERAIAVDGRRRGHLLDPRTGAPAPDFGSLTVVAADAAAADCLSTGLYALGPDAALAWAAERPDVEVLVLELEEPGPGPVAPEARRVARARATAGLRGRLTALSAALPVSFARGVERASALHDPLSRSPFRVPSAPVR